jgi:hypothetical protein
VTQGAGSAFKALVPQNKKQNKTKQKTLKPFTQNKERG